MSATIPSQNALPLKVAVEVVSQGIRIRMGRSMVTVTGIILGVAFLMSIFTTQTLKQGVADEDRLRNETQRMSGFLTSEIGPFPGQTLALTISGNLSELEKRMIQQWDRDRLAELRLLPLSTISVSVSNIEVITVTDSYAFASGAAAIVAMGDGDLPEQDWKALASLTRQKLLAHTDRRTVLNDTEIRQILLSRIRTPEEQARLEQEAKEDRIRSMWIIAISVIVTIIGISNAMLMSVTERFRDIGTMKCLGALSRFVRLLFLLEATFMGAVGGILGVIVGFAFAIVSYMFVYGPLLVWLSISNLPIQLTLAALIAFVIGVVLSIIAALYPAHFAARMVPADALRSSI